MTIRNDGKSTDYQGGLLMNAFAFFEPSFKQIQSFIGSVDSDFADRLLYKMDPARVISLSGFEFVAKELPINPKKIAIVSGTRSEPELYFIRDCAIDLLDFEKDPLLFDLTRNWEGAKYKEYLGSYDFVLCEQVLEHLPTPERAIQNLASLLKPGGILHISVPGVNNTHGLPHYFYAGFPPQTLEYFSEKAGLTSKFVSGWVNDKAAMMYAVCDWTPIGISGGVLNAMRYKLFWKLPLINKSKILIRAFKHSHKYSWQSLFPNRKQNSINPNYVICWGFFQK